jgi:hypothetical protein
MELKPNFSFTGTTQAPAQPFPDLGDNLGPLVDLPGVWKGSGFNVIWRPNSTPGQDRFLELNLTDEQLEFESVPGAIPNRGLLQPDIDLFGVRYLQQISDANTGDGLHVEPGLWIAVPPTTNPPEAPTVVRMASIPHGTTLLAQGAAFASSGGPPPIPVININPFPIGNPAQPIITFPEPNLAIPSQFRSPAQQVNNITQAMIDNPNSVLTNAIASQQIKKVVTLLVSSDAAAPVLGGGTSNTAFLQGAPSAGPNAQAALVTATFWIETVTGTPDFLQLQYTQTVLLNFNGLSWPHITVATLRKQ